MGKKFHGCVYYLKRFNTDVYLLYMKLSEKDKYFINVFFKHIFFLLSLVNYEYL